MVKLYTTSWIVKLSNTNPEEWLVNDITSATLLMTAKMLLAFELTEGRVWLVIVGPSKEDIEARKELFNNILIGHREDENSALVNFAKERDVQSWFLHDSVDMDQFREIIRETYQNIINEKYDGKFEEF